MKGDDGVETQALVIDRERGVNRNRDRALETSRHFAAELRRDTFVASLLHRTARSTPFEPVGQRTCRRREDGLNRRRVRIEDMTVPFEGLTGHGVQSIVRRQDDPPSERTELDVAVRQFTSIDSPDVVALGLALATVGVVATDERVLPEVLADLCASQALVLGRTSLYGTCLSSGHCSARSSVKRLVKA